MKYSFLRYKIIGLLLGVLLAGCSDETIPVDNGKNDSQGEYVDGDGPMLNVVVTLDNMGGSRSSTSAELSMIENFIDVEKLRVLFFTCVPKDENDPDDYDHDYFLFESKSRWVKKIDTSADNSWLVSIPLYSAANDTGDYNWNWTLIREMLTNQDFKIAVLANRPDYDYADKFTDSGDFPAGFLDNDGPVWTVDDAVKGDSFATADYSSAKDVFDLHHCQYDRNYIIKSTTEGYYTFMMGGWDDDDASWPNDEKGVMALAASKQVKDGATSSWVDWTYKSPITGGFNDGGFTNTSGDVVKHFRHPSLDYPIPMYGLQRFSQISDDDWLPGTPFELSGTDGQHYPNEADRKTVSLLRSVVKCEIIIPKTSNNRTLNMVTIAYANIYARCEPMDVWTPTDKIWNDEHGSVEGSDFIYPNCELNSLLRHGSICNQTISASGTAVSDYQNTMVWFFGRWKEKGWKFKTPTGGEVPFAYNPDAEYPRLFNPCIQRNQLVACDDNVRIDEGDNWRYVVYLGERNSMDPSNLNNLHATGVANNLFQYWMVQYGDDVYAVPITDYSNTKNVVYNLKPVQASQNGSEGKSSFDGSFTYISRHRAVDSTTLNQKGWYTAHNNMEQAITSNPTSENYLPWPLIRNHVYTITLTTKSESGSMSGRSIGEGFKVSIKDNYSKKI